MIILYRNYVLRGRMWTGVNQAVLDILEWPVQRIIVLLALPYDSSNGAVPLDGRNAASLPLGAVPPHMHLSASTTNRITSFGHTSRPISAPR